MDSIKYVGYIEAKLTLPLGSQTFEIDALLLVLPSTDYQRRVPVTIGTTITDMVVEYISQNNPENVTKSWKAVCCATQSKWLVQVQPKNKYLVRTTKPITLPLSLTLPSREAPSLGVMG